MLKKIWNKFKAFYNDTYGMLIVVSWAIFIICLIIKLFGGNWFELGTSNTKFISFCEYVDTNQTLKMILACLIYLINGYPVICIMLNHKRLSIKETSIFIPLMITKSIISWYSVLISYIIDSFILIILPLILTRFKGWKRVIFGNVLIFVFKCITLLTRNIGIKIGFNVNNLFLIQAIFQLDYFLMIVLFYLYFFKSKNKKRGNE